MVDYRPRTDPSFPVAVVFLPFASVLILWELITAFNILLYYMFANYRLTLENVNKRASHNLRGMRLPADRLFLLDRMFDQVDLCAAAVAKLGDRT
jgi:hypothetical protein